MEKPTILTAERVYKQRYPDATKKELVIVLGIYKELIAEYEAAQRAKVEREIAVVKGVKETGKKVKVKEFLRQSLAKAREARAKRAKVEREVAVIKGVKETGKKEKVKAFLREAVGKARARKEKAEAERKAKEESFVGPVYTKIEYRDPDEEEDIVVWFDKAANKVYENEEDTLGDVIGRQQSKGEIVLTLGELGRKVFLYPKSKGASGSIRFKERGEYRATKTGELKKVK